MAGSADVLIRFIADTASASKEVQGFGSQLKSFGGKIAGFIGGAAVGAFAADAVNAANDMAESVSKVRTVFGDSSRELLKFTENAATNLGLSRRAATDAAGAYGNLFTQLGLTTGQSADMSKGLLTLTSDLASFHNADPTAILEAQSAAFRGEYDAIQRFIPTLNAATVETRALADTGKTSADQLTATEKAAATYALMMEGAGKATGDFARTSDSAANQQRILQAKTDDASVSIGQALQPAIAVLVPILADMATAFAGLEKPIQLVVLGLGGLAIAIAVLGAEIALPVAALVALVAAAVWTWENWDQIWTWIKEHPALAAVVAIVAAPIASFVLLIGGLKLLWENWDSIWSAIKGVTSGAVGAIGGFVDAILGFFRSIPGAIMGALSGLWEIITRPFRDAYNTISGVASDIKSAFSEAVGFVKGIWNGFARAWNGIEINIPSVDIPLVGSIGGGSVSLPNLPILGAGGIINGPTLALLGERGREAVVPLPARGDLLGGSNVTYEIAVSVAPGTSPVEVGGALIDAIRAYERVNGSRWRSAQNA